MNVRRLAAIDMYGTRGTARRKRIVLAEFTAALAATVALGTWLVIGASGLGTRTFGIWPLSAGLNYAPLAAFAIWLSAGLAPSKPNWPMSIPAGSCAVTAFSNFGSWSLSAHCHDRAGTKPGA